MKFFNNGVHEWFQFLVIEDKSFICGYCGHEVASNRGYCIRQKKDGKQYGGIYICPSCQGPNFIDLNSVWHPGQAFGKIVDSVPEALNNLYEEARRCHKENCFTASVLLCRKMLMNIAVEQGAKENLNFVEYVNYLSIKHFIPPNGKMWVDHIRKKVTWQLMKL